jgi:hypothetical protein
LKRIGAAALACAAGLMLLTAAGDAESVEPVRLTATAPAVVAAQHHFDLKVRVATDPGALDIAVEPLRLRVRLASECGGSYAGTEGTSAIDRKLPAPTAGRPYGAATAKSIGLTGFGTWTVCAFLEDGDRRQFASDGEATIAVTRACTKAARRLTYLRNHGAGSGQVRGARHRVNVACRPPRAAAEASAVAAPSQIDHLFVIVLENEDAEDTFGVDPPAPYLGKTMREAGAYIPNYYGIGHQSLDNYIAMVSGQPPNLATQADCLTYTEMRMATLRADGVAVGQGCVYPPTVPTVANQLEASGHSWRGYMQDMAGSLGEADTCRHPGTNSYDQTQMAGAANQYAARHNPFVYFHSILDSPTCRRNVVDLGRLPADLASAATTPEYVFITPDMCADGHDATCPDGTSPGGFAGIDAFLREWVPRIEASPAYADRGAILVTFDEAENNAQACCNEPIGPNTLNNGGPQPGNGGGRVGAVVVSPCVRPGTVSETPYNHYSLLRWTEDNFGLPHLGYAGTEGLSAFGSDVFSRPSCADPDEVAAAKAAARTSLRVRPRRTVAGRWRMFRFRLVSDVAACQRGAVVRFAAHRARTDRRGRAWIGARLAHPRQRTVAVARPSGCKPAKARVEAVPRAAGRR